MVAPNEKRWPAMTTSFRRLRCGWFLRGPPRAHGGSRPGRRGVEPGAEAVPDQVGVGRYAFVEHGRRAEQRGGVQHRTDQGQLFADAVVQGVDGVVNRDPVNDPVNCLPTRWCKGLTGSLTGSRLLRCVVWPGLGVSIRKGNARVLLPHSQWLRPRYSSRDCSRLKFKPCMLRSRMAST